MAAYNLGSERFAVVSRNPDGVAHARVSSDFFGVNTTLVSFENLFEGPFRYNSCTSRSTIPQSCAGV